MPRSSITTHPYAPFFSHDTMINTPCFIDGIPYDNQNFSLVPNSGAFNGSERVKRKCHYTVSYHISRSILQGGWFKALAEGACTSISDGLEYETEARSFALCQGNDTSTEKWWLSGLYNDGNATFATISDIMRDVATALTDSMRLASIADGLNENNTINGTVWQASVCTKLDWRWLLFPIALIALTIVSLVLMILSTASSKGQIPVWKSSILPFLYMGKSEIRTMSLEEMKQAAKKDEAALQRNETGGWQLIPGDERRDNESE
jgi:hypothetical protein